MKRKLKFCYTTVQNCKGFCITRAYNTELNYTRECAYDYIVGIETVSRQIWELENKFLEQLGINYKELNVICTKNHGKVQIIKYHGGSYNRYFFSDDIYINGFCRDFKILVNEQKCKYIQQEGI